MSVELVLAMAVFIILVLMWVVLPSRLHKGGQEQAEE